MSTVIERAAVRILDDMSFGYSKKEAEELVGDFPAAVMTAQERKTIREFVARAESVSRGKAAKSILRAYSKQLGESLTDGKISELMWQARNGFEHVDLGHLPVPADSVISDAVERLRHYRMDDDPDFEGFELDRIIPVYFYDELTDKHLTVGYTIRSDASSSDGATDFTAYVGVTVDGRELLNKII